MAGSGHAVRVERDGPVAVISLTSPPLNILSAALLAELAHAVDQVQYDPKARAVVLTSAVDKAFAAGANIREMAPMDPREADRHAARGQSVPHLIEASPLPFVAAVHGACLGGGCEIVQACDFVLASEDAVFGQPEVNLGVMPGWGGTQRLPRRIGAQRAREWVLLGDRIPAAKALADGLVLKVVPRPALLAEATGLARTLAQKPPLALAAAKYALNYAIDRGEAAGLAYERRLWARLFGTPDQREGMTAFTEKRPPVFWGRDDWVRDSQGFPWAVRVFRRARGPLARAHRARRRRAKA